jgi:hypothetical protein
MPQRDLRHRLGKAGKTSPARADKTGYRARPRVLAPLPPPRPALAGSPTSTPQANEENSSRTSHASTASHARWRTIMSSETRIPEQAAPALRAAPSSSATRTQADTLSANTTALG